MADAVTEESGRGSAMDRTPAAPRPRALTHAGHPAARHSVHELAATRGGAISGRRGFRLLFGPPLRQDAHSRGSIRALDGVRGLAIASVVYCHLDDLTPISGASSSSVVAPTNWLHAVAQNAGTFGVMLFFVLSGFLLFLPYARALVSGAPWPNARTPLVSVSS